MIYWVRHRTSYTYAEAVTYSRCVLRLTPPTTERQTVFENTISITPEPSDRRARVGAFGENTLTVVIDTPHRSLVIEAASWVDVRPKAFGAPDQAQPWETVSASAFQSAGIGPHDPATYLYPAARTPIVPAITDYARESFAAGRPIVEAASELMHRMRADFTYDTKATTVSTPASEAFAERRGVCQDFAHIMIAGLRGLGLPAAYVSGYLRTTPPPGEARLQGADATHAWISLWCGEAEGWIGFDPTNALIAEDKHVTLATGRDYSDVAPIDGVTLSPGKQKLEVEVDVIPEDELSDVQLHDIASAARPLRLTDGFSGRVRRG